ncbi:NYN domain-containing protein [Peptostreptococcus faecalis]|uniref:NYN domain-containing protein n=1 Tax=Peptostreptococcus faecalis TaxID=2045015 RepID=UPI000C7B55FA|nr:NYN domain-containing protein [Peptostreptococcus faecalis]
MKYTDKEMQKNRFVPRKILIVDGYNIINAWPKLKKISEDDLEASREILIGHIMEYANIKGYEAYVVFDAYNVKGLDEKIEHFHDVEVVFTRENQTADSYIEKFISTLSKYDEVAVATSDYAEQQIVLGKGFSRVSARELVNDFSKFKENIRKSSTSKAKRYDSMNRLENKIDSEIFEKLERIRRKK